MANLAKDPMRREQDARAFGHAIIDAAKQSGLAPEDISRPMLRRPPGAMRLPPTERTKQHDLSPDVVERMTPSSQSPTRVSEPAVPRGANGAAAGGAAERPLTAATAKWEPPTEFQARLAELAAERDRPSGVVPASPSSRPFTELAAPAVARARGPSGVDETMDDASLEPPPAGAATLATPPPSLAPTRADKGVPRTMADELDGTPATQFAAPVTQFAAPVPEATSAPPPAVAKAPRAARDAAPTAMRRADPKAMRRGHDAPPISPPIDPSSEESAAPPGRSRGVILVAMCFVLGMIIAAGWAWKVGKLGGDGGDDERFVARATDAMYKNRFVTPPGDNVREITDEGLKRFPNSHRLLDVRMRAANELVSQAMTHRSAGDLVEALRLARMAQELDPNDASARRLVEQYEGELAALTAPSAPTLGKVPVPVPPAVKPVPGPAATPAASAATAYKIILESSAGQPRLGQTVELTARVAPPKGTFENPLFTITGPGLGGGVVMPGQSAAPGVWKASYAFAEAGRFEVAFTAQTEGTALKAARSLISGDPAPAPKLPDPAPKPTAPAPTASVKWM
jgi:serine/threonine-protein kinase